MHIYQLWCIVIIRDVVLGLGPCSLHVLEDYVWIPDLKNCVLVNIPTVPPVASSSCIVISHPRYWPAPCPFPSGSRYSYLCINLHSLVNFLCYLSSQWPLTFSHIAIAHRPLRSLILLSLIYGLFHKSNNARIPVWDYWAQAQRSHPHYRILCSFYDV